MRIEKKYYVIVEEEFVEVSEDVYRAYYQPIWRVRYYARKNDECRCPKHSLWKCDGICPGCQFYTSRKTISLDDPLEGGSVEGLTLGAVPANKEVPLSSMIERFELIEALHKELARLSPEDRLICELIAASYSERQASQVMGMSRSAFKRRWAKIKVQLSDKLKDYR